MSGNYVADENRRRVYKYYFLPEDDKDKEEPLVLCPSCGVDLSQSDSVLVDIENTVLKSHLDCGVLQDTPELTILSHGVEAINCISCGCNLAELDNVYEDEMTI